MTQGERGNMNNLEAMKETEEEPDTGPPRRKIVSRSKKGVS